MRQFIRKVVFVGIAAAATLAGSALVASFPWSGANGFPWS
jgi:hypothetical protein